MTGIESRSEMVTLVRTDTFLEPRAMRPRTDSAQRSDTAATVTRPNPMRRDRCHLLGTNDPTEASATPDRDGPDQSEVLTGSRVDLATVAEKAMAAIDALLGHRATGGKRTARVAETASATSVRLHGRRSAATAKNRDYYGVNRPDAMIGVM